MQKKSKVNTVGQAVTRILESIKQSRINQLNNIPSGLTPLAELRTKDQAVSSLKAGSKWHNNNDIY